MDTDGNINENCSQLGAAVGVAGGSWRKLGGGLGQRLEALYPGYRHTRLQLSLVMTSEDTGNNCGRHLAMGGGTW